MIAVEVNLQNIVYTIAIVIISYGSVFYSI
jgi:hypothetical protein